VRTLGRLFESASKNVMDCKERKYRSGARLKRRTISLVLVLVQGKLRSSSDKLNKRQRENSVRVMN